MHSACEYCAYCAYCKIGDFCLKCDCPRCNDIHFQLLMHRAILRRGMCRHTKCEICPSCMDGNIRCVICPCNECIRISPLDHRKLHRRMCNELAPCYSSHKGFLGSCHVCLCKTCKSSLRSYLANMPDCMALSKESYEEFCHNYFEKHYDQLPRLEFL